MNAAQLVLELKYLDNGERLAVIEAATRLIRDELKANTGKNQLNEQDRSLRSAAEGLKELYEPGGEMTEWSALDGEQIHDDTFPG